MRRASGRRLRAVRRAVPRHHDDHEHDGRGDHDLDDLAASASTAEHEHDEPHHDGRGDDDLDAGQLDHGAEAPDPNHLDAAPRLAADEVSAWAAGGFGLGLLVGLLLGHLRRRRWSRVTIVLEHGDDIDRGDTSTPLDDTPPPQ